MKLNRRINVLKQIVLNYGKKDIELSIPKNMIAWQVAPKKVLNDRELNVIIRDSLENPINTKKIEELAKDKKDAIIVIDDNTRPTPVKLILPEVIRKLNKADIEDKNIKILVALGTHRKMTKEELIEKCGENILNKYEIIQHDYQDESGLVYLGLTDTGIPVSINKAYYASDFKITIGNIIPHVDAGWSGGAKILLPGICGKETINSFHLKSTLNKDGVFGKTENCIRRDMEHIAKIVGLDFLVNTVLDVDENLAHVVSGHYINAHREGVRLAKKLFEFKSEGKVDMVIVSSYPADEDFWQAGKAISAAGPMVKNGGNILLISPCYRGIAPDHPILIELAGKEPDEVMKLIDKKELHDLAGAAVYIDVFKTKEKFDILLYSEGINGKDAEKIGFKKTNNIKEFLEQYVAANPFNRIGIINRGTEMMPNIEEL